MKQSGRTIGQLAICILLVIVMMAQFGCAGEVVHALDYTLENELYDGQTEETPPTAEATPPAETAPAAAETTPAEAPTASSEVTAPQTPPLTPAETPSPSVTSTVSPSATDAIETPLPSQTPELHHLRVFVQDAAAAPLVGARVTLFQDEAVLFSGMTGSDGNVSWSLPMGHTYRVGASMAGYQACDGDGGQYDMAQDVSVKITLVQSGQADNAAATPTPLPVPDGAPGKVHISASDVTIQPKQAFALLDGVSAQTEFGQPVAVWVVVNGGFSAEVPGVYAVTYGAFEEGALITALRNVTVAGDVASAEAEQPHAPYGSSTDRYEILMEYRELAGDALSERIAVLNAAYQQKVEEALAENAEARILAAAAVENDTDDMTTLAKDVQQTQDIRVTNWPDVLATFLAQNVSSEDCPLNAYLLRDIPLDRLDSVFWDMNPIEVFRMDGTANVLLSAKNYEDMVDSYGMSAKRRNFLYELMQPEFQRTFASMTGSIAFNDASEESIDALLATLPEDTNVGRKEVVETALSLVGKISYVLGGKYNRLGWNDAWGNANVAQEGDMLKISRDKGLDCSGFVSWAFINALGDPAALRVIGNGSSNQWAHSTAIGWDEGRPGDLAFYCAPGERQYNHIGIIVAVDDGGSYLVAHCSSLQDGVVVTDGWSTGFRYLRRPAFFQ